MKIAGPDGPSQKLRDDIKAFFELPEDRLLELATWSAAPQNPLPSTRNELVSIASEQGIDIDVVRQAFPLIQFILTDWRARGYSLDDLISDFDEIGVKGHGLEVAHNIFSSLENSKDKFFLSSLRGQAEIVGLATLDDINLIWDIRPVFEDADYSFTSSTEAGDRWMTNVYLLITDISCSRRDGKKESISLQLTELDFAELQKSIEKAKSQLDILKRKQFV